MRTIMWVTGLGVMLALAGCAREPKLMNIESGQDSPDEFAILPTKALTMPPDLAVLPTPTPGGANITDPSPMGDAVAALGGNPAQLTAQGVGAGDGALMAHAGRVGVQPGIRQQLAAEDAEFRSRRGRRPLEVLARTSVYLRAYRPMLLDPQAEMARWRAAGARVPTAPPPRE